MGLLTCQNEEMGTEQQTSGTELWGTGQLCGAQSEGLSALYSKSPGMATAPNQQMILPREPRDTGAVSWYSCFSYY